MREARSFYCIGALCSLCVLELRFQNCIYLLLKSLPLPMPFIGCLEGGQVYVRSLLHWVNFIVSKRATLYQELWRSAELVFFLYLNRQAC